MPDPPMSNERVGEAYYFGCWKRAGHFFFLPHMRAAPVFEWDQWFAPTPWGSKVDGHLTPGKRDHGGRLAALNRGDQGAAALHHKDGWTALAVHDFTVDSRGGSNSVFFFNDTLDFDEAVAAATGHFPEVVARIGPMTLVETA